MIFNKQTTALNGIYFKDNVTNILFENVKIISRQPHTIKVLINESVKIHFRKIEV